MKKHLKEETDEEKKEQIKLAIQRMVMSWSFK